MLKLTTDQRALFAEKVGDAANLGLGGLAVGQFLSDRPFSFIVGIGGVLFRVTAIGFAIVIRGRVEHQS